MKDRPHIPVQRTSGRSNWLFEIEPYSRPLPEMLADLRDNMRLKKLLKRAVKQELAPLSLVEAIRAGIRA